MIGERIKSARQALGYSAEQVAELLHVSPATIYRYENGDISKLPARLIKPLAEILCVTPGYLMEWDEKDTDLEHIAAQSRIPPPGVVVPDNALFLRAVEVLSPEDLDTLNGIFARAFDKLNIKEKN